MFDYKCGIFECWGDKYIDKSFESNRYIVIKLWKFTDLYDITTQHTTDRLHFGVRFGWNGSLYVELTLGKWKLYHSKSYEK